MHWVGYPVKFDCWIQKTDSVLLHQKTGKADNFAATLSLAIKRSLTTSRLDSRFGTIELPFEAASFSRLCRLSIRKPAGRRGYVWHISNRKLADFLGSYEEWAYRIINGAGDFVYVSPGMYTHFIQEVL